VINETMTTASAWRDQARKAEALGFATFLIRDHLVPDHFGPQFAPFSALATAAAVTSTLRLGTYMIDNDFRHPAVLAKEAATLDLLSDGRFELGLGAGWLTSEYDKSGIPFDPAPVRLARMEESICILKQLLSGEPADFHGDHYAVSGLENYPPTASGRKLPLVIGGGKKRALQLAGRHADTVGVMTSTLTTTFSSTANPEERRAAGVRARLNWIREGAGERFPHIELSTGADIIVTDHKANRVDQFVRDNGWDGLTPGEIADMPLVQIGSLDAIADGLRQARAEYGFSYFVVADAEMDDLAPLVARLAGE
jgi:probable F420-dependent oxidoreductase